MFFLFFLAELYKIYKDIKKSSMCALVSSAHILLSYPNSHQLQIMGPCHYERMLLFKNRKQCFRNSIPIC